MREGKVSHWIKGAHGCSAVGRLAQETKESYEQRCFNGQRVYVREKKRCRADSHQHCYGNGRFSILQFSINSFDGFDRSS